MTKTTAAPALKSLDVAKPETITGGQGTDTTTGGQGTDSADTVNMAEGVAAHLTAETLVLDGDKAATIEDTRNPEQIDLQQAQDEFLTREDAILRELARDGENLNTTYNVAQFLCAEGFRQLVANHASPSTIPNEAMRENAEAALRQAGHLVSVLNGYEVAFQGRARVVRTDLIAERLSLGIADTSSRNDDLG